MRADTTAFAVWLTGLPASGKSTVAGELVRELRERGIEPAVLGIPYEPPEKPDLVVRGDQYDPREAARRIINLLIATGAL
jgi:adenylylsulfate kinase-like enzyme